MLAFYKPYFTRFIRLFREWVEPNVNYTRANRLPTVWFLALFIGLGTGCAGIMFRELIGAIQWLWLGTNGEEITPFIKKIPWYYVVIIPTFGGLFIGLYLRFIHPGMRANGVADVIEARAKDGSHLSFKAGISSAFLSAFSLGVGGSSGREGPVVHLGAMIADTLSENFKLPETARRKLLACGVAGAIAASFNAPIAGVLFAHEVILGHYAVSAFMPIVIASVASALIGRLWFGDISAFIIPDHQIVSYFEFPAFALLGVLCAAVAIAFQLTLIGADFIARHPKIPFLTRPVIGGFLLGCLGLLFPQILGVGYEAIDLALQNDLSLSLLFLLVIAKTIATAITLAARFGGGIFSPALYIGAMSGGAFGALMSVFFAGSVSSEGLYSILGMGAVAAAVLGAPISTVVMVFELTGGYSLSVALLLCVSISTGLTSALHGRSFFDWQLRSRGVVLDEGPHKHLLQSVSVSGLMHPIDQNQKPEILPEGSIFLLPSDSLEKALHSFNNSGQSRIDVIQSLIERKIIGHIDQVKALSTFNRALIETSVEEHR